MSKYVKSFFHRGVIFGGFGPIVAGIVYLILDLCLEDLNVGGIEMFTAIISTYLLAFIHAGASIFNQIDNWPIAKSLLFHFTTLYLSYTLCYFINSWIPFKWSVFLIYTGLFVLVYLAIWMTVLILTRRDSRLLNSELKNQ